MIKIDRLVWEEWNISHIAKHKVVQTEVEEALHNKFIVKESYRDRLVLIGKTNQGRSITTIVHEDEENIYYVVTARDASLEEQEIYENEINKQKS
jgi:uncharacterized DUF497 family protein